MFAACLAYSYGFAVDLNKRCLGSQNCFRSSRPEKLLKIVNDAINTKLMKPKLVNHLPWWRSWLALTTLYTWIFCWRVFLICVSMIRSVVACSMLSGFNLALDLENLELAYLPRASGMCCRNFDLFCRDVANSKSCAHKCRAQWLAPRSMVEISKTQNAAGLY